MSSYFPENPHRDESLKLLGEFFVNFENTVDLMRNQISRFFVDSDKRKCLLILSEYEAYSIQKILRSLFASERKADPEQKQIDAVFKAVENLIAARNKVIHGNWRIGGYIPDGDGGYIVANTITHTKPKITKGGMDDERRSLKIEDLKDLMDWSNNVLLLVYALNFKLIVKNYMFPEHVIDLFTKLKKSEDFFG